MTKTFTEIIKLSDASLSGFEQADRHANSPARKKQELARKKRRERLQKFRKTV